MSDFEQAQKAVHTLSKKPDTSDLLDLYAYFKQGTDGDVSGEAPSMFNINARFKYEAWKKVKGMSQVDAQQSYVNKVNTLLKADGK